MLLESATDLVALLFKLLRFFECSSAGKLIAFGTNGALAVRIGTDTELFRKG